MTRNRETSRWLNVFGSWETSDTSVTFLPEGEVPVGVLISEHQLKDGEVDVSVRFQGSQLLESPFYTTTASVILGHDPSTGTYLVAGLGGAGAAYVLAQYNPTSGWRWLRTSGVFQNIEPERIYQLNVRVTAGRIAFSVDGIEAFVDQVPGYFGTQVGLHAQGTGPIHFEGFKVNARLPTAFAVMEFSPEFDTLYQEVLIPVANASNLELRRADDISGPGVIMQDIIRDMEEATLIVAEISSRNPNVFYEVGYADALGKPVILLARKGTLPLPFDLSGKRVIFYDDTIGGKRQVEQAFQQHLHAILRGPT